MTTRRILLILVVIALGAMWGTSIMDFGELPGRFPSHFDAAGVPDRYAEKSATVWFTLPLLFTVMSLFFLALGTYLPRMSATHAAYINIPDKEAFLALSDEGRARAIEPMGDLMLLMIIPLGLLSAYITHGSYLVAKGRESILSPWPVALVVGFAVTALAVSVVRTKNAIAREKPKT